VFFFVIKEREKLMSDGRGVGLCRTESCSLQYNGETVATNSIQRICACAVTAKTMKKNKKKLLMY